MDPLVKPSGKAVWHYMLLFTVYISFDLIILPLGISLLELPRQAHSPRCSLALLILMVNGDQAWVSHLGLMKHFMVHPFSEILCCRYKWLCWIIHIDMPRKKFIIYCLMLKSMLQNSIWNVTLSLDKKKKKVCVYVQRMSLKNCTAKW